jgi:hypothetical protein
MCLLHAHEMYINFKLNLKNLHKNNDELLKTVWKHKNKNKIVDRHFGSAQQTNANLKIIIWVGSLRLVLSSNNPQNSEINFLWGIWSSHVEKKFIIIIS